MSAKASDLIYALAWWMYDKLGYYLKISKSPWVICEEPQVIYKDRPETQETLARLVAENDELRKLNQQLTWALDGHHGVQPTGPNRPNAKKLTEREVFEIRDMKRRGWTNVEIATAFDVNRATISRIVRGQYHKKASV